MGKLKNIIFNKLTCLLTGVYFLISCVEPYEINFKSGDKFLIIDGKIDDSEKEKYITIRRSVINNSNHPDFFPEDSAKVQIIENGSKIISATNSAQGLYFLPVGFKAKIGSTYQLVVSLKNGEKYESSIETMKNTPEIKGHTVKFNEEAIKSGDKRYPGHTVYVDTYDNPEKGDNYMWTYRIFERQAFCISCYESIYMTSPAPLGRCLPVASLFQTGNTYDYFCSGNCWEILNSSELNIMSDRYSNSLEIKNRLIAKVPFYSFSGFVIEITQQNIDEKAFRYLKILLEQNQTNGTLADSPPAALIGNIKNINNKSEIVGGYFMVANSSVKSVWVPRNYTGSPNPIGLLNGRIVNPEPSAPSRPPVAPCVKSKTRTPLAPEGWPL